MPQETEPIFPQHGNRDHLFLALCSFFFLSFFLWAFFGKLDIASVAEGKVIPSSKVKSIQHLEGGIIKEILVKEGDVVQNGQPLLYLEEIQSGSSVEEINIRIASLKIDIERMAQEINGRERLEWPDGLLKEEYSSLRVQAQELFTARRKRYQSEIRSQKEKIGQREQDIREIETRLRSNKKSLTLLEEQIRISSELLKENLSTQYNHLNLLREATRLKSLTEEDAISLERAHHSLNEEKEKEQGITHIFRENAREELKKSRREFDELSQRNLKFKDSLTRAVIRSPIDGVVKSLYMVTEGGVITPGMTILDIVPAKDRLIIEANLPINDIGYIQTGQKALIKLASPEARRFGEIEGKVITISPDAIFTHEGRTFYTIHVETASDRFERDSLSYKLYPGVIVHVFIHTGQRTVFEYLMDPFLNTLGNALMER
jgi:adhesin transport system membrane fusion protein